MSFHTMMKPIRAKGFRVGVVEAVVSAAILGLLAAIILG